MFIVWEVKRSIKEVKTINCKNANLYCCMSSQNSYQSNVANIENSKTNFSNYPQMLAPDGVHKTLFILKVVVKAVSYTHLTLPTILLV